MIGIDTNVLVRYLVQDDPEQSKCAQELFSRITVENPAFVSDVVLVETYWILNRVYNIKRGLLLDVLMKFVNSSEIKVRNQIDVFHAVERAKNGADFADALIYERARSFGCEDIVTFDKKQRSMSGLACCNEATKA